MQFNVENLFLYTDAELPSDWSSLNETEWKKLSISTQSNKPLLKLQGIANSILRENPDIIMLNEVGGDESLRNFVRYFLNDRYQPWLKEGNSERGIDVGYLIKNDLPFRPLLISHKDRSINFNYLHETRNDIKKTHYFSRDVAELRLFSPEQTTPTMVILLTHLKSKLDKDGIDPYGRSRREAELRTLIEIFDDIVKELGSHVPVMIAGDFNGFANGPRFEPEFTILQQHDNLIDVFDIAQKPLKERVTQVQFLGSGFRDDLQLDYIFVTKNIVSGVVCEQTYVHRFIDHLGGMRELPLSMAERMLLPSDHYPVIVTLNLCTL